MDNKLCILGCGRERIKNRRYCRECYLRIKREAAKEKYAKFGKHKYTIICTFCGNKYDNADRKSQKSCATCWKERLQFITKYNSTNNYENKLGKNTHRELAEHLLKRTLNYNEVVHHLDHNPINNSIDNIIVLERKDHIALHNYLYDYEFKLYKLHGKQYKEYWNGTIEKDVTLKYLNENKINYISFEN